jgi:uncharacterized RDD family membrane protein YckC
MLRDCPRCGLPNQPGDYFCVRCGLRLSETPASVAPSSEPALLVSAGFARRAVARLVDVVVYCVLGGLAASSFLLWLGAAFTPLPISIVALVLMTIPYHAIAESVGGATVGKLLLSLRVVGEDGERPRLRRCVVRNLWMLVDWLPAFGLVAYIAMQHSPQGQRLGDSFGHTLVLQRRDVPGRGLASPRATAHGIVLGLAFAGALLALLLLLQNDQGSSGPTA